jgi:hypothetical protein
MFELILENANGDQLSFAQNSPFTISEIQGLNPPDATINMSELALIDGAKFNSAKLNLRTINIAFAIEYAAAANRIEVYKVLKSKQYVKMFYNGSYRHVYIEGYIESIDITYFEIKQIVTCTILCPSPYFKDAQDVVDELSNIVKAFHFPFASTAEPELVFGYFSNTLGITIENDGDAECGMIIQLYARNPVSNPKIFDYITNDYFGIQCDLQRADLVTIDTRKGQKSVTLLRGAAETNLFNYIMQGSTWLQLPVNGGTYVYEVGSGNTSDLNISFTHTNLYEGV